MMACVMPPSPCCDVSPSACCSTFSLHRRPIRGLVSSRPPFLPRVTSGPPPDRMRGKTCILTVGSTRFDPLVHAFLSADSLASLAALGITTVVAQVGNSALPGGYEEGSTTLAHGLELRILRFAADLEEQVGQADLVVSHAGTQSTARTARLDRSAEPRRSLPRGLRLAYRRRFDPLLSATSRQLCQSRDSPGL